MKRALKLIDFWSLIRTFFVAVIFFFLIPSLVSAAEFTFSNTPSSINQDEEFSASVTLSIGSSVGKNYYIRAAFSHSDSLSSYFGYTKNNIDNWYNGTPSPIDYTQFYKITMDDNNQWTGTVQVKPDSGSSAYKGGGVYAFKLGRYTESGSGPTWSDTSTNIVIVAPPTPTPTLTTAPTNTPAPTPTKTPTSTPTPTKIPTSTPTPVKTPTATPTPKPQANSPTSIKTPAPTAVLGEKTKTNTPTPTTSPKPQEGASDNLAKILIGLGVVFLGACGILAFRAYKEGKGVEL